MTVSMFWLFVGFHNIELQMIVRTSKILSSSVWMSSTEMIIIYAWLSSSLVI